MSAIFSMVQKLCAYFLQEFPAYKRSIHRAFIRLKFGGYTIFISGRAPAISSLEIGEQVMHTTKPRDKKLTVY